VRLNQVTVASTDIRRSKDFYLTLGLHLIVEDAHYLRFECPDGDSTFSVELTEEASSGEQITVYFECDDLDADFERLRREAGVEFEHPPTDMAWLWREARLRDPDGHRLCLFHAGSNRRDPPWRIK
jgi:catechol 2,3-dioxygenase-like lactoylglutathione lyase family enzyme